jgi:hypothetical protein
MTKNPNSNPISNNLSWGLTVPGRPLTPSEGFAQVSNNSRPSMTKLTYGVQAYQRVGPVGTQKTKKFDNGTCLTFGPDVRLKKAP